MNTNFNLKTVSSSNNSEPFSKVIKFFRSTTNEDEQSESSCNGKTPLDETYQPKVVKCETDGIVQQVPSQILRQASRDADELFASPPVEGLPVREPESRVMVLYTGGTIGMRTRSDVYVPEPNYLPKAIREIPHLHDQHYVEAFFGTLPIKPYVLPPVKGEERRVVYWVFEYEPLLDSSDMTFDDWIRIGKDIYSSYDDYDGFVILHGTDTLSYTASALSFMFENLGKTVILTGAQIPVAEVRSDGRENLIGALIIAANYNIPEVSIYFNNKLMRGSRAIKMDNSGLDAFTSPNTPPLATTEISIHVNWDNVYRSPEAKRVTLHTALNRNVGLLRIFPSVTIECIRAFLMSPIQGVVLQTFGAGNIPSNRLDIIEEFKKAIDRGVIIVNCSQCVRGQVVAHYHAGKVLNDAGIIPGSDMTPEAALAKLAYVLGKDEWNLAKKKKMVRRNLRGELTVVKRQQSLSLTSDSDILTRMAHFLHISTSQELVQLRNTLFPPLVCTAAADGNVSLIDNLKENGANLHNADYDGRTAMHVAACDGHLNVVDYLLLQGVSVHAKDRYDTTPLIDATRKCHFDIIKSLYAAGARLKMNTIVLGIELCSCAYNKNIKSLKAWKLAGADLNTSDYDKRTALHVAATQGNAEVVEFLLDSDVETGLVDAFGYTPMQNAVSNNHHEIVKMLLNYKNQNGDILLNCAHQMATVCSIKETKLVDYMFTE